MMKIPTAEVKLRH